MQAYEGYLENGRFFPIGPIAHIVGRRKVIMTVIDEPKGNEKPELLSRKQYLAILDDLCGSIDDPTFVEPPEIPLELNSPREIIV